MDVDSGDTLEGLWESRQCPGDSQNGRNVRPGDAHEIKHIIVVQVYRNVKQTTQRSFSCNF